VVADTHICLPACPGAGFGKDSVPYQALRESKIKMGHLVEENKRAETYASRSPSGSRMHYPYIPHIPTAPPFLLESHGEGTSTTKKNKCPAATTGGRSGSGVCTAWRPCRRPP
jgi:hypothetical protein